jgi:hypothetical protein|nr:MAG TPA: hypothetical protein [Caudoviricetes sp.]
MNTIGRIDAFISTLREAHKAGLPSGYSDDNPADKLITLTGNISDLCWEIAAIAKQADPSNKIITADSIKHNATNILIICITELENLGYATDNAIELIATDGALWFWNLNQCPLNKLDQDVDPADRIQSLNVAMGRLLEWWPNKITPQIGGNLNSELERHFIDLAYEAACTIIAHNH